jgi:nitric oxide reductase activation protein
VAGSQEDELEDIPPFYQPQETTDDDTIPPFYSANAPNLAEPDPDYNMDSGSYNDDYEHEDFEEENIQGVSQQANHNTDIERSQNEEEEHT